MNYKTRDIYTQKLKNRYIANKFNASILLHFLENVNIAEISTEADQIEAREEAAEKLKAECMLALN